MEACRWQIFFVSADCCGWLTAGLASAANIAATNKYPRLKGNLPTADFIPRLDMTQGHAGAQGSLKSGQRLHDQKEVGAAT